MRVFINVDLTLIQINNMYAHDIILNLLVSINFTRKINRQKTLLLK